MGAPVAYCARAGKQSMHSVSAKTATALANRSMVQRESVSGSSAAAADVAAAARSGWHSHPLRPVSLIGPSRAGASEGTSVAASIALKAPALANAVRRLSAPRRSKPESMIRETTRLDITSIIAELLKNR